MMNEKEMKQFAYVDSFGEEYRVTPTLNMYAENDNLYVGLEYFDTEFELWMPYGDVTVNVGQLPYLESAIDTNNNGRKIVDWLVENGFGELTGEAIRSGFCQFPVFRFKEEMLVAIDDVEMTTYAKAHGVELKPALDDVIKGCEARKAEPSTEQQGLDAPER